ncbi:unnamed protein product [Mytilus coruscus]|uniref:Uncharacterized protein n=1 Tax=Mytilus coruscus TaxID=42192 RepID=A0A6J8BWH8_MYTCO|nr:unnamed protein product [Mytilus coruscus]
MDRKLKSPAAEKITTMYRDTQDVITKVRYLDKLKIIGDKDPSEIEKREWAKAEIEKWSEPNWFKEEKGHEALEDVDMEEGNDEEVYKYVQTVEKNVLHSQESVITTTAELRTPTSTPIRPSKPTTSRQSTTLKAKTVTPKQSRPTGADSDMCPTTPLMESTTAVCMLKAIQYFETFNALLCD